MSNPEDLKIASSLPAESETEEKAEQPPPNLPPRAMKTVAVPTLVEADMGTVLEKLGKHATPFGVAISSWKSADPVIVDFASTSGQSASIFEFVRSLHARLVANGLRPGVFGGMSILWSFGPEPVTGRVILNSADDLKWLASAL